MLKEAHHVRAAQCMVAHLEQDAAGRGHPADQGQVIAGEEHLTDACCLRDRKRTATRRMMTVWVECRGSARESRRLAGGAVRPCDWAWWAGRPDPVVTAAK